MAERVRLVREVAGDVLRTFEPLCPYWFFSPGVRVQDVDGVWWGVEEVSRYFDGFNYLIAPWQLGLAPSPLDTFKELLRVKEELDGLLSP